MPRVSNDPVSLPNGRGSFGGGKSTVIMTTNQWPDRTTGPFAFDQDADELDGYPEADADDSTYATAEDD